MTRGVRNTSILVNCARCGNTVERFGYKKGAYCSNTCARRSWQEANRHTERERSKRWRTEFPEKYKASKRKHYSANRDKIIVAHKDWQLRRDYGISLATYDLLCATQNNCCAICYTKAAKRKLRVDHDHATSKRRGLICDNCNLGLGKFRDDPDILSSAVTYLLTYRS
jgi:hypothetical protein